MFEKLKQEFPEEYEKYYGGSYMIGKKYGPLFFLILVAGIFAFAYWSVSYGTI